MKRAVIKQAQQIYSHPNGEELFIRALLQGNKEKYRPLVTKIFRKDFEKEILEKMRLNVDQSVCAKVELKLSRSLYEGSF